MVWPCVAPLLPAWAPPLLLAPTAWLPFALNCSVSESFSALHGVSLCDLLLFGQCPPLLWDLGLLGWSGLWGWSQSHLEILTSSAVRDSMQCRIGSSYGQYQLPVPRLLNLSLLLPCLTWHLKLALLSWWQLFPHIYPGVPFSISEELLLLEEREVLPICQVPLPVNSYFTMFFMYMNSCLNSCVMKCRIWIHVHEIKYKFMIWFIQVENIVKSYARISIYEFILEFMHLNSWLWDHKFFNNEFIHEFSAHCSQINPHMKSCCIHKSEINMDSGTNYHQLYEAGKMLVSVWKLLTHDPFFAAVQLTASLGCCSAAALWLMAAAQLPLQQSAAEYGRVEMICRAFQAHDGCQHQDCLGLTKGLKGMSLNMSLGWSSFFQYFWQFK